MHIVDQETKNKIKAGNKIKRNDSMTYKQIKEQINAIRKVVVEIGNDKNKAKQFLIDSGIIKERKMKRKQL
jgi:hypothetical protein